MNQRQVIRGLENSIGHLQGEVETLRLLVKSLLIRNGGEDRLSLFLLNTARDGELSIREEDGGYYLRVINPLPEFADG